jgi:Restriction endonuclease fold toxin 7
VRFARSAGTHPPFPAMPIELRATHESIGRGASRSIVKNTERIPSASGTAAYRIPDMLDHGAQVIGEVKNVASLSYTNQLRDFASYAQANGYQFQLTVRATTKLSGPLMTEVAKGTSC